MPPLNNTTTSSTNTCTQAVKYLESACNLVKSTTSTTTALFPCTLKYTSYLKQKHQLTDEGESSIASAPGVFPEPKIGCCADPVRPVRLYNPATGESEVISGNDARIIISEESDRGYLIEDVLRKAIYGQVNKGHVLEFNLSTGAWEMTCTSCAIKALDWRSVRENSRSRRRKDEDPLTEIAAMQYYRDQLRGSKATNVMTSVEVLRDDATLYIIMPFCKDGELFDRVEATVSGFHEDEARHWMKQLTRGIQSLHDVGICHRDLSLENVLVHNGTCQIIDFGMCLRMPEADIVQGDKRPLVTPQGSCGKLFYMSPEVYNNREAFDGEAIDVWSAGVMLFMMLIGSPAYGKPDPSDDCFAWITTGRLPHLLKSWGVSLSLEAVDLMEGMLCVDPKRRLTLRQVMNHPWFKMADRNSNVPPPPASAE